MSAVLLINLPPVGGPPEMSQLGWCHQELDRLMTAGAAVGVQGEEHYVLKKGKI